MNRKNFNWIGGYPLKADTLEEIQKTYNLLNVLGELAGDKAILQGCFEDGESVGDGVVYVNGEVFAFRGGRKQATVIIEQEALEKTFKDGQRRPVLYKRWMAFGSGPEALNWSEFKRYRLIEEVADFKAQTEDKLSDLNAQSNRVNTALADKAPRVHKHDYRYYTQDQTEGFFEGESEGKKQVHWDRVTEKPTAYPPAPHNHDTRYYRKGEIKSYASFTDKTYATVGRGYGLTSAVDFYGSDKACCAVTAELQDAGDQDIQVLTLEFAKIQLLK